MSARIPPARVAHVPWWRRLLARFRAPSEMRDLGELVAEWADERVRLALNNQLSDLLEHIRDRDSEIILLRAQVRDLGGTPRELHVLRKPLPTFIPGAGIRVSK